jgi:hypothetical protein
MGGRMRIKLYHSHILLEVCETSKHLDYILDRLSLLDQTHQKRLAFLHAFYYMCVHEVRYQNPIFYAKLAHNTHKKIYFKKLPKNGYQKDKTHTFLDYYSILGAGKNDSLQAIRKKYISLAKRYHPDKIAPHNKHAIKHYTKKFQQIQEAYHHIKSQKVA